MSTFDLESWLRTRRAEIDALLATRLEALPPAEDPGRLVESMRYSLLAPGKRLRPLLVLAAAEAVGRDPDEPLRLAAAAVELVHCYSLVHDDLPAMDDDDFRRGQPTNHKVFGEATAILAGDALLTLAFQWLAEAGKAAGTASGEPLVAQQTLRAIIALAKAAGAQPRVVEGERILGAALRAGVWVPYECGWGSCGTCKMTVVEGEVEGDRMWTVLGRGEIRVLLGQLYILNGVCLHINLLSTIN